MASVPVDLAALAGAVFSELKNMEKGRRIEFKVGALPAAHGDPSMLRLVLQNLLANAIKFTSKGYVEIRSFIEDETDKEVRVRFDIVDTGITLNQIRERILTRFPLSLRICTFLDKKERREVDIPLDYVGYVIPNQFVVGYGLDYDNKYRNLPYISIFRKKA